MNAICDTLTRSTFTLKTIDSIDQFAQLKSSWERINNSPLQSFTWNFNWWQHFQHLGELNIYVLMLGDEAIAIAPFYRDRWSGQTCLRLLGSGSTCTDYVDLIVPEPLRAKFVAAIAEQVIEDSIDMIELDGVCGDPSHVPLTIALEPRFWQYETEIDQAWPLALAEDWEAFVSGSKKSLRRKIRKAEKHLSSGECEIESTAEGLCKSAAFDTLVTLHQARFAGKGETGAFSDVNFESFLRATFLDLSENDQAEIIVGSVAGKPIAAQMYFAGPKGPMLYQAGFDMQASAYEPGHLLLTWATRRAIENGHHEFDFLRGDEPYKHYWGATPRSLKSVRLISRKPIPTSIHKGLQKLQKIKEFVRGNSDSQER